MDSLDDDFPPIVPALPWPRTPQYENTAWQRQHIQFDASSWITHGAHAEHAQCEEGVHQAVLYGSGTGGSQAQACGAGGPHTVVAAT